MQVLGLVSGSFTSINRTAGEEAFPTKPGWFQTLVFTADRNP